MVIFAWSALVLVRRVVHGTSVVDGDRRYREYAHHQSLPVRPGRAPVFFAIGVF
jgi:hypothetical protein